MIDQRAVGLLLLASAIALLVFGASVFWPVEVDDAYITLRYAQNLVDGFGPVFNPGERVEGYSNPSWMLLLAGVIALGIDPVAAMKVMGFTSAVVLTLLVFREARRFGASDRGAGFASLVFGAALEVQAWSVGGMETLFYSLLFFAGVTTLARAGDRRSTFFLASIFLVGAALTRPEGIAFWGAGLAIAILIRREHALAYGVPGLVLLAHVAWRYSYYGEWVPNTYFAKAGDGFVMWGYGLGYLVRFLMHPIHALWTATAIAGAVAGFREASRRTALAIVCGAVVCHVAYVVSVGGDALGFDRFFVPILAPLALLVGLNLPNALVPTWRRLIAFAAAALTAAYALAALLFAQLPGLNLESRIYQEGNERLGRYLAQTKSSDTWIAVSAAGAIPYYSGLPTIDMLGLSDRHIARRPFADAPWMPGHMKWDNAYVLSREPDLIVINKAYFRAGDLRGREAAQGPEELEVARGGMEADLFARVGRDPAYEYRAIVFPDGARHYVFERKKDGKAAP